MLPLTCPSSTKAFFFPCNSDTRPRPVLPSFRSYNTRLNRFQAEFAEEGAAPVALLLENQEKRCVGTCKYVKTVQQQRLTRHHAQVALEKALKWLCFQSCFYVLA